MFDELCQWLNCTDLEVCPSMFQQEMENTNLYLSQGTQRKYQQKKQWANQDPLNQKPSIIGIGSDAHAHNMAWGSTNIKKKW